MGQSAFISAWATSWPWRPWLLCSASSLEMSISGKNWSRQRERSTQTETSRSHCGRRSSWVLLPFSSGSLFSPCSLEILLDLHPDTEPQNRVMELQNLVMERLSQVMEPPHRPMVSEDQSPVTTRPSIGRSTPT